MQALYRLHFCNNDHDMTMFQTPFIVGVASLTDLIQSVPRYIHALDFNAYFGLIKEFTDHGERNTLEVPAKVGKEKLQAFVLKRKGDVITNEGGTFFINGKRLTLDFTLYDVSIVEINW